MIVRCQSCGASVDYAVDKVLCRRCGTLIDPRVQLGIRAGKRFELIKFALPGSMLAAKDLVSYVDHVMDELYGRDE